MILSLKGTEKLEYSFKETECRLWICRWSLLEWLKGRRTAWRQIVLFFYTSVFSVTHHCSVCLPLLVAVCICTSRVQQEKMGLRVYQELWEWRYDHQDGLCPGLSGLNHIDHPLFCLLWFSAEADADTRRTESETIPTQFLIIFCAIHFSNLVWCPCSIMYGLPLLI